MLHWKQVARLVLLLGIAFQFSGSTLLAQAKPEAKKPAAKAKAPAAEPKEDAPADAAPAVEEAKGNGEAGNYWIIDFEQKSLRMIAPTEGIGASDVYWYLIYTLTNSTKEDRSVYVKITATSDHNKLYSDLFLPSVEKAIERKENQVLWGKTDEFAVLVKRKPTDPGYQYVTIKAGEKRNCVAVFNRLDPNANKITLRIEGLSNQIREVVKEDGSRLLESRVRELYYERPGDEHAITLDSFVAAGQDWVKKQVAAGTVAPRVEAGNDRATAPAAAPAAPPAEPPDADPAGDAPDSK